MYRFYLLTSYGKRIMSTTTDTQSNPFPIIANLEEGSADWGVVDISRENNRTPLSMLRSFVNSPTRTAGDIAETLKNSFYLSGIKGVEGEVNYYGDSSSYRFDIPFKDIHVVVTNKGYGLDESQISVVKALRLVSKTPGFKAFQLNPFHTVVLAHMPSMPQSKVLLPVRLHLIECSTNSRDVIGDKEFINFKYNNNGIFFDLTSEALSKIGVKYSYNGHFLYETTINDKLETFDISRFSGHILNTLLNRFKDRNNLWQLGNTVRSIIATLNACRLLSKENMGIDVVTGQYTGNLPVNRELQEVLRLIQERYSGAIPNTTSLRSYKPMIQLWTELIDSGLVGYESTNELERLKNTISSSKRASILDLKYGDLVISNVTGLALNSRALKTFKQNFENSLQSMVMGKDFFLLSSSAETITYKLAEYWAKTGFLRN